MNIVTIVGRIFGRNHVQETPQADKGRKMALESATKEFFQAVRDKANAEIRFNNLPAMSDRAAVDAVIADMNIATLRVDNATRKLRQITGVTTREEDGYAV